MQKISKKNPVKDWIDQYKSQFDRYNDFSKKNNWTKSSNIEDDYDFHVDIANIVCDRLSYFLDKFEPYLKYKYVQDFVDKMNESVILYLDRSSKYINDRDWSTFKDEDKRSSEMKFQAKIMRDFNKVKDKLQKIDLDKDVVNVELPIFSDKSIPFLMSDIIESKYPDIINFKENSESLHVVHDAFHVDNSSEMFKNIKNPPFYDPSKSYFEQPRQVLDFYKEELNKIINGVYIAGVFIHPWLYWHINFFKTDIPMVMFEGEEEYDPSKEKIIHTPFLRDNEMFLAECYHEADINNLGLFIFGTRRAGKTVIESSILTWRTTIVELSESLVIGGDDGDLLKLSKTLEIGFSNVHPAFRLHRNNSDWKRHIQFGVKTKNNTKIPYSDIFIKNVNNTVKGGVKTAGSTPTAWIVDEAGKFNCKKMYKQAIPSFQNPKGWSVVPILTGTGGNAELSRDAQQMLTHPKENKILPMDWERLEKYVSSDDLITWDKRKFGIFVPAQMSFKEGLIKDKTNLADFLSIPDKRLKEIDLYLTNWEKSLRTIKEDRKILSDNPEDLSEEKMSYPIDPLECFLNKTKNPFPAKEALIHYENLRESGDYGNYVDVYQKTNSTSLYYNISTNTPPKFPFGGGISNGPVIMFQPPPDDPVFDGTFVAGLDHYKQTLSGTDSVGCLTIFKRNVYNDITPSILPTSLYFSIT